MAITIATGESSDTLATADIREHYDRLSPLYRRFWGEHIHHGFWRGTESNAAAQRNLTHELARRAGIAPGDHVLDVGCGLGGSAFLLARDYGCTVRGISISPRQIASATRGAARRGLQGRVTFGVEDANHLDGPAESYDVIWNVECSEHLFDKPRFIATSAKLLRPGGRLAICAWLARENLDSASAELVREVCRGMLCPSLGSLNDYVRWMEQSGLSVQCADDITPQVARTWSLCKPVLRVPLVRSILAAGNRRLRDFADAFAAIDDAYRTGAMAYGMFVAAKPAPDRAGT
jgi:tocopherol O-methyltransferase